MLPRKAQRNLKNDFVKVRAISLIMVLKFFVESEKNKGGGCIAEELMTCYRRKPNRQEMPA
jgi:hypothetical protein